MWVWDHSWLMSGEVRAWAESPESVSTQPYTLNFLHLIATSDNTTVDSSAVHNH